MNNGKIKRHLERFVANNQRQVFGCTAIMIDCRIGYNEAYHVLEMGFSEGIFERTEKTYRAKMVESDV